MLNSNLASMHTLKTAWHVAKKHFELRTMSADGVEVLKKCQKFISLEMINGALKHFIELLQQLPPDDLGRPSLKNTILTNKGSMSCLRTKSSFCQTWTGRYQNTRIKRQRSSSR
ncbi:hypothetical protein XENOCAPTIV_014313 [Xenoophorus captivus]|uniref:Uncharacterized protein n=1 Tax=Xenoophorus captivus TaxID=1517983 RepID=A0ABV0S8X8_9TELE